MSRRESHCIFCDKAYNVANQWGGSRYRPATRYLVSGYCSLECFRQEGEAVSKDCQQCGNPYGPYGRHPHAFAKSKYCSRECNSKAQQNVDFSELIKRVEIDPTTGCHNWLGQKSVKGYGLTRFKARMCQMHRLVWEQLRGSIPKDKQIDHLCNNTSCCNIEHLRVVTPQVNSIARNFRRHGGKCPKCGEEYSRRYGMNYCKPCRHKRMLETQRQRRAAKKAAILAAKEKESNESGI